MMQNVQNIYHRTNCLILKKYFNFSKKPNLNDSLVSYWIIKDIITPQCLIKELEKKCNESFARATMYSFLSQESDLPP